MKLPGGGSRKGGSVDAEPETRAPAPHLSRLIEVENLPDAGLLLEISADAAECAAIAGVCGLPALQSLEASLSIKRASAGRFHVGGLARARVTQTCVVSLEPFDSLVEADVDADFAAPPSSPERPSKGGRKGEAVAVRAPSTEDENPPDPIVDGRIDVGALVEEFLILNLDSYPRRPGVEFAPIEFSGVDEAPVSPFVALKKLKKPD